MYIITNGTIVTADELLLHRSVLIEDEQIIAITSNLALDSVPRNIRVVDAKGGFIMPGFIDIHSDYIETIASPRPSVLMDFEVALYEAERELLTHGITTMYHSLSLTGNRDAFKEKPIRQSENVLRLVDLIEATKTKAHLIHHRMHLRYEISNFTQMSLVEELIRQKKIHLLSFMDHTPGQGQYRNLEVYRLILAGYHDGDYEKVDEIIAQVSNVEKISFEQLAFLAQAAKEQGISLASHDDDTLEKLAIVEQLGSSISEFPITEEVAFEAQRRGLLTVGGAPNVLLGKSHSGNLSVIDAIKAGTIDILCSDYYPSSLLHAIFKLWQMELLTLPEAVKLVSLHPAQAVGIDQSTGSIAVGKQADLIIVNYAGEQVPVVTHTFAKGVLISETTYRL
ncbi:MAG: phosphonate metabolism protein PhnM [Enterococcus sp.]